MQEAQDLMGREDINVKTTWSIHKRAFEGKAIYNLCSVLCSVLWRTLHFILFYLFF